METTEGWRLGHRPALDGLRGVAVALVVVCHALVGTGQFNLGGTVGVAVFFVLSGYLITGLMVSEHSRTGRVSLRRFYQRRVRRLAPALVVVVAAAPLLLWAAGDPYLRDYAQELLPTFAYYRNLISFDRGHGFDGVLAHAWSLSVEEQFYLLWPGLLLAILGWCRLRALNPVVLVTALALGAVAWRMAVSVPLEGWRLNYRLDTNAAALLVGAAMSVAESRGIVWHAGRAMRTASLGGLLLVSASPWYSYGLQMWAGTLAVLLTAALISRGSDRTWLLTRPWLTWLGRISYGLYLWHFLFICVWVDGEPPGVAQRIAACLLAVPAAALSLRFIEAPFRQGRSRARVEGPTSPADPVATSRLAV